MEEKNFSSVIKKSVEARGGFCNKMPDPSFQEIQRGAPKRPYDLYFVLAGDTTHVESKFLKGYQAFALSRVADHQYENLLSVSKNSNPKRAIVAVAVWEPRVTYDVFFFTINILNELRRIEKKSISKKEMLALRDKNLCLSVKNGDIPIDRIQEVLIWQQPQLS